MIRKATLEDIPKIQAIAQIAFRLTYKDILSPQQMDYMMEMMYSDASLREQMGPQGNVFFIEEGKGYASVRFDRKLADGSDCFHLEKLYVLPGCQKTGLGRELFGRVVEQARSSVCGKSFRIELNVNRANPAVGFYEHIGMRKDRQGDFPIGGNFYMNDYIMAMDFTGMR